LAESKKLMIFNCYYIRSEANRQLKKYSFALMDVEKSIELKVSPENLRLRGSILGLHFFKFDEAIRDLTRSINMKSPIFFNNGLARYERGIMYENKKMINEAIKDYSDAALNFNFKKALFPYAQMLYLHKQDYVNSLKYFKEYVNSNDDNKEWIKLAQQRIKELQK